MSNDEIRALCNWFLNCDRSNFPDPPFELTKHQTITGSRFFDFLTEEAASILDYLNGDRSTPPVRFSGAVKELQALRELVTQIEIERDYDDW